MARRRDPAENPLAIKIGDSTVVYIVDELVWGPFAILLGGISYAVYHFLPPDQKPMMERIAWGWQEGVSSPFGGTGEHLLVLVLVVGCLYLLYILALKRYA